MTRQSLETSELKTRDYDIVIVGSGMGGGTLAFANEGSLYNNTPASWTAAITM